MKSIEKPYEYLGEKEKQILELCQEIILWGTDLENTRNSRSLEIKEKATELYDYLSSIDMNNDDKYYKLHAGYDQLKNEFEEVKNTDNYTYAEIEGNFDELLNKIKSDFKSGNNIVMEKNWENYQEKYGDYVRIEINHFEGKVELAINEMHDSLIYENNLINEIKKIFENFKLKYEYNKHDHGERAIEYSFKSNLKKFEKFEKLLLSMFEIVEKTRRIFKKH